ncbi:MAG: DUF4294 domain-containing protein [Bacteroidota bacterium]
MILKQTLVVINFLLVFVAFSQEKDSVNKVNKERIDDFFYQSYEEDELDDVFYPDAITLDEVYIMPKLGFASRDDITEYLILRRKTRKVWPYAHLAAKRLDSLNKRLATIESNYARKQYTKRIQHYIENEFSEELKKLTKTEGQILIKLMYRQTGETAFELVKELRTGWRAFWYNTTASMFNISMKETYNPKQNREDFLIEDILQRSFNQDVLERQPPAFRIDFYELMDIWKDEVNIYDAGKGGNYRIKGEPESSN